MLGDELIATRGLALHKLRSNQAKNRLSVKIHIIIIYLLS